MWITTEDTLTNTEQVKHFQIREVGGSYVIVAIAGHSHEVVKEFQLKNSAEEYLRHLAKELNAKMVK